VQKFVQGNFPEARHFFATVAEHLAGEGFCLQCKSRHKVDSSDIDIRTWSPPCQPFSDLRWKGGTSSSTGSIESHPAHSITMDDLVELTETSPARITLIEQVMSFTRRDPKTGKSPCEIVMSALEKVYGRGRVAAVSLDSAIWIEGSRPRPASLFFVITIHNRAFIEPATLDTMTVIGLIPHMSRHINLQCCTNMGGTGWQSHEMACGVSIVRYLRFALLCPVMLECLNCFRVLQGLRRCLPRLCRRLTGLQRLGGHHRPHQDCTLRDTAHTSVLRAHVTGNYFRVAARVAPAVVGAGMQIENFGIHVQFVQSHFSKLDQWLTSSHEQYLHWTKEGDAHIGLHENDRTHTGKRLACAVLACGCGRASGSYRSEHMRTHSSV
jgi:hypothetical protein